MLIRRSKCLKLKYFDESISSEIKYLSNVSSKILFENENMIALDKFRLDEKLLDKLYTVMSKILDIDMIPLDVFKSVYGLSDIVFQTDDKETTFAYPFSFKGCLFTIILRADGRFRGFLDIFINTEDIDTRTNLPAKRSEEFTEELCNILDKQVSSM